MTLLTEVNVLRVKVGLYAGLIFFSFFVFIAIPITTDKIGACLLYLDNTGSSSSNCNYAVAMAVIFGLLYSAFRVVTLILLMLGKLTADFVLFSDLCQLIYTAVDAVALFLVFISACIVSAGINSFCGNFPNTDCSDITYPKKDDGPVSRMRTGEAGAWISFILWLVMVVLGVFWLFRQGKLPFLSKPAGQTDGNSGAATGPSPQMDTPPASDPKY